MCLPAPLSLLSPFHLEPTAIRFCPYYSTETVLSPLCFRSQSSSIWSLRTSQHSWSFPAFETLASFGFQDSLACVFPLPHWLPFSIFLMSPPYIPKCPKTQFWLFSVHTYFLGDLFQSYSFKYHRYIDYSHIHIFSSDSLLGLKLIYLTSAWVFLSLYSVSLDWPSTEEGHRF